MRAMILAAGYGTRLWPLTADRTKPAIPFLGRPLVGYVAEYLASFGVNEIIVNLHHEPESVRESLGDGTRFGVKLEYIEEPEILGTSGALDNARAFLEGNTFCVVNGKIITDINLAQAIETHRRTGALATLVLLRNAARERFSMVHTQDGFVTGFGGMPTPAASDNAGSSGSQSGREADEAREPAVNELGESGVNGAGELEANKAREPAANKAREPAANEAGELAERVPLMFTGIQILEPRVFDYIPRNVFSHSTTDVYPQAIASGERIAAHVAEGSWYELSTINRYLDISLAMLEREGRDVELGQNSFINAEASVRNSILWDDVTVEAGARVSRAVLGDGVRIRVGEVIENAAVVRRELIDGVEPPAKALRGEVRGDNFVVSLPE